MIRQLSLNFLVATALLACGTSDPGTTPPDVFSPADGLAQPNEVKMQLISDVAENVVLVTLGEFVSEAKKLEEATAVYASSMTDEGRQAAQAAWRSATSTWQKAEVMQLGPSGLMGDVLGGEDRRDEIYSWPVTNPCRIDQETLEEAYATSADLAKEAVNTRGLDAIEYLLFHPDGNGCKVNSAINKDGTWKGLEAEIPQRQATYAASAATLVRQEAEALLARWQPGEGDFAGTLKGAGAGSSVYPSVQEALNAITDAMFYIEKTTKDMKVAEPVGFMECDTQTCPEDLESQYAGASKDAVLANLDGVGLLLHGGADSQTATGFDDLLILYGAIDLAADLDAKLVAARAAVQAVPGTFREALSANLQEMEAAYEGLKGFTDLFKTQFLSVLDLEIPSRAASDSD